VYQLVSRGPVGPVERCLASPVAKAMEDKCEADNGRKPLSVYPETRCPEICGTKERVTAVLTFGDQRKCTLEGCRPHRPHKRGSAPGAGRLQILLERLRLVPPAEQGRSG
jgi:hypothetical protein